MMCLIARTPGWPEGQSHMTTDTTDLTRSAALSSEGGGPMSSVWSAAISFSSMGPSPKELARLRMPYALVSTPMASRRGAQRSRPASRSAETSAVREGCSACRASRSSRMMRRIARTPAGAAGQLSSDSPRSSTWTFCTSRSSTGPSPKEEASEKKAFFVLMSSAIRRVACGLSIRAATSAAWSEASMVL
eukprot:5438040-Prymnesium_polylepis.1